MAYHIAGTFLAGYAIARILVEFVRLPDEQIGYLAILLVVMGMVLSIPILLIGAWSMFTASNLARLIRR